MGSVRARGGLLFFDFRYKGVRCREQTRLQDSAGNRKRLEKIMQQIENEIDAGEFDYSRYFPESKNLGKIREGQEGPVVQMPQPVVSPARQTPSFASFCEEWYLENEVRWKRSYRRTVRGNLDKHLIPNSAKKRSAASTRVRFSNSVRPSPKFVTEKKKASHQIGSITS